MKKEIIIENAKKALEEKDIPPMHYMVGKAKIVHEGNKHSLTGKVNFFSEGNPTVERRTDKYLKNPHVNYGDCDWAFWNAAHLVGDSLGYTERGLRGDYIQRAYGAVPPDTELDIEFKSIEKKPRIWKNRKMYFGRLEVAISLDGKVLMEGKTKYFARKD